MDRESEITTERQPFHCQAMTTLDKLFAHLCLFDTGQKAVTLYSWKIITYLADLLQ